MRDIKNISRDFLSDMKLSESDTLVKLVALEILRTSLVELYKYNDTNKEILKGDLEEVNLAELVFVDYTKFESRIMYCAGYWSNDISEELVDKLRNDKVDTPLLENIPEHYEANSTNVFDNVYKWCKEHYKLDFVK